MLDEAIEYLKQLQFQVQVSFFVNLYIYVYDSYNILVLTKFMMSLVAVLQVPLYFSGFFL